jgi:imidazolonepropionase-like amidohydrolase
MTTLLLRNATLVDGTGAEPKRRAHVLIDGERIAAVSFGAKQPPADQAIDLEGRVLLPGLIDAHTHLGAAVPIATFTSGMTSAAELAAGIFRNCRNALEAGFTTVRDVGGLDGGVAGIVARGVVPGPRIIPAGPALVQHGGHGCLIPPFAKQGHGVLDLPGLAQDSMLCDGPDQVRYAAREAFRRGARFIKVIATGGVVSYTDSIEDTQFTVEEIRAAVVEAEARQTYVTAHAHNRRGMCNAVAAGVRCIEHGVYLDEPTALRLKEADVAIVPTITVLQVFLEDAASMGLPAEVLPRVQGVDQAQRAAVLIARAAGLRVGSGADLLGPDQRRFGLEIALKAELLGVVDAIRSATAVNAEIIGLASEIGTVEAGKLADLLVMDAAALDDPLLFDGLENRALVLQAGRICVDHLR